jgi:hypothetical protein
MARQSDCPRCCSSSSSPRCSQRWLQPSAFALDYGYLHAAILTGSAGGQYHALAMRLSERARREHGTLTVISTAGSIENMSRLASNSGRCGDMFALIQDGTPAPARRGSSCLAGSRRRSPCWCSAEPAVPFTPFPIFAGHPSGSARKAPAPRISCSSSWRTSTCGAGYPSVHHELPEQAKLVAEGKLDLAAFVMQDDAEFLYTIIR